MREENIFSDNYKCPAAYHVELGLGYACYPVYNMFIDIPLDFHHLPHQFLLNIFPLIKTIMFWCLLFSMSYLSLLIP